MEAFEQLPAHVFAFEAKTSFRKHADDLLGVAIFGKDDDHATIRGEVLRAASGEAAHRLAIAPSEESGLEVSDRVAGIERNVEADEVESTISQGRE
jgi:hypothetical protein